MTVFGPKSDIDLLPCQIHNVGATASLLNDRGRDKMALVKAFKTAKNLSQEIIKTVEAVLAEPFDELAQQAMEHWQTGNPVQLGFGTGEVEVMDPFTNNHNHCRTLSRQAFDEEGFTSSDSGLLIRRLDETYHSGG